MRANCSVPVGYYRLSRFVSNNVALVCGSSLIGVGAPCPEEGSSEPGFVVECLEEGFVAVGLLLYIHRGVCGVVPGVFVCSVYAAVSYFGEN